MSSINPVSSSYPSGAGSMPPAGTKPPKYKDGKLNDEWVKWKEGQNRAVGYNAPGTTVPNREVAPPVVCSMEEKFELEHDIGREVMFTEQMNEAFAILQNPNYAASIGLDPDDIVDSLGTVMAKYEVPIGLSKKLVDLAYFDYIEFILDDSGSMTLPTDSTDTHGRTLKRKDEALSRMLEMIEVLCYIKAPKIKFRFLNHNNQKVCLELDRQGQAPEDFYAIAKSQIEDMWDRPSWQYTTPMRAAIEKSIKEGKGQKVVRYIFGDGVPSDRGNPIHDIEKLVTNRKNAKDNPITFMSCTDKDNETEWMKVLEEKAPFCSESDDYQDELREVRGDQGEAFPYTRGFYIICELVAAMNPEDLDCMDECIAFSKHDFDFLQGYVSDPKDYQNYFHSFLEAQKKRSRSRNQSKEDKIKNGMNWNKIYKDLVQVKHATEIKEVQKYQQQMRKV